MKWLLMGVVAWAVETTALGQHDLGYFDFFNTSSTLITVNGILMPVSGTKQFNFAIFFAPANTVDAPNQMALFTDPVFQTAHIYTTNSARFEGGLVGRRKVAVLDPQFPAFSSVDFIIRGWSADAGTTWEEALANWNNGTPLIPMTIGSSVVGDNFYLFGNDLTPLPAFGTVGPHQVRGFNLVTIPEPSTYALLGMSAVTLWLFRRRSP